MTTNRRDVWLARLNYLGTHPEVRAARAAECVLLGHIPTDEGEFFAVNPPLHVCYWCAGEFHTPTAPR